MKEANTIEYVGASFVLKSRANHNQSENCVGPRLASLQNRLSSSVVCRCRSVRFALKEPLVFPRPSEVQAWP